MRRRHLVYMAYEVYEVYSIHFKWLLFELYSIGIYLREVKKINYTHAVDNLYQDQFNKICLTKIFFDFNKTRVLHFNFYFLIFKPLYKLYKQNFKIFF